MTPSNAHSPESVPYSIPRRFGLGAMLVMTTVFAVLFALMRAVEADLSMLLGLIVYLLAIALAQICLPKWPRAASMVTGTILFPVLAVPVCNVVHRWVGDYNFDRYHAMWVIVPCSSITIGPLFGYLCGAAGAGLFLMMDRYRPGKLSQLKHEVQTDDRETASDRTATDEVGSKS